MTLCLKNFSNFVGIFYLDTSASSFSFPSSRLCFLASNAPIAETHFKKKNFSKCSQKNKLNCSRAKENVRQRRRGGTWCGLLKCLLWLSPSETKEDGSLNARRRRLAFSHFQQLKKALKKTEAVPATTTPPSPFSSPSESLHINAWQFYAWLEAISHNV